MAKKVIMKIDGMHCTNCAMQLEGIEDRLPGVQRAEASYHKGHMLVVYDESKTSEEHIRAEVKRLGYQVVAVQPA